MISLKLSAPTLDRKQTLEFATTLCDYFKGTKKIVGDAWREAEYGWKSFLLRSAIISSNGLWLTLFSCEVYSMQLGSPSIALNSPEKTCFAGLLF